MAAISKLSELIYRSYWCRLRWPWLIGSFVRSRFDVSLL